MARNFTCEQLIEAIDGSLGLLTNVARRLNCDRNTVERYVNRFPKAQEALKNEREKVTDVAEGKLFQALNKGERWAVKFYLTMQAQQRGYMTTQMVKQDNSKPLNINLSGVGTVDKKTILDASNVEVSEDEEEEATD